MFTTDISAALLSVRSTTSSQQSLPGISPSPPSAPSNGSSQLDQSSSNQSQDSRVSDALGFPSDDEDLLDKAISPVTLRNSKSPRQPVVRINKKWSRILCSAYVMCDLKMDSLFRENRVRTVMAQIKKAMEEKTKQPVNEETVKLKIQNHIYSKNTARNEKQGNRLGTKKRSAVIAGLNEDTSEDEVDIVPDVVRPLSDLEQMLEDGEDDHASSSVDSETIRTADNFLEFSRQEKSNTQIRNEAISEKRGEKISLSNKIRRQEESRDRMEEMKTMVMASCMRILEGGQATTTEDEFSSRLSRIEQAHKDTQRDVVAIRQLMDRLLQHLDNEETIN